jgi:hypothetical protein
VLATSYCLVLYCDGTAFAAAVVVAAPAGPGLELGLGLELELRPGPGPGAGCAGCQGLPRAVEAAAVAARSNPARTDCDASLEPSDRRQEEQDRNWPGRRAHERVFASARLACRLDSPASQELLAQLESPCLQGRNARSAQNKALLRSLRSLTTSMCQPTHPSLRIVPASSACPVVAAEELMHIVRITRAHSAALH